jgi:hypothetical protein
MGRNFTPQAIAQLTRGAGGPLRGDAGLILLKGLLQSGVAYLGGYPGRRPARSTTPLLTPINLY